MIPVWWILIAFVAGGCGGLLLFALIRMAADQDAHLPLATELRSFKARAAAPFGQAQLPAIHAPTRALNPQRRCSIPSAVQPRREAIRR